MKKLIKPVLFIFLAILILINVLIFVRGIQSAVEITKIESQLVSLKEENYSLENKLSEVSSLSYAASMAAELNFSQKTVPFYLDGLKYALNR